MSDYLNKKLIINLFTVIIIFSLDRISKFYIILKSEANLSSSLYTSKFLNINLIWNEGIAFGLFSVNRGASYQLITLLIIIIVIILIYLIKRSKNFEKFGFILILGGALGNLFDRIFYKAVPDFIDFHINNFHWFIFNVADIFITTGVFCLIFVELFYNKKSL